MMSFSSKPIAALLFLAGMTAPLSAAAPSAILTSTTKIVKDTATFNGTVTSNGAETTAFFDYVQGSFTPPVGLLQSTPALGEVFASTAENETFSQDVTALVHGAFYQLRLRATNADGGFVSDPVTIYINAAPKPKNDDLLLEQGGEVEIAVLENDTDPDGLDPDPLLGDDLIISAVTTATDGSVRISTDKKFLLYTPAQSPKGYDTITYTVSDQRADHSTATAILTIRSPKLAFRGMQAFELKNLDGTSAGLVRLVGTGNGSFTGKVTIGGKSYILNGELDANGKFKGTATGDDGTVSVSIALDQGVDGTSFTAKVVQGSEVFESDAGLADLTASRREELAGKYTIEIPPSGSEGANEGDLPQGIGFARVEVKEWGDVRIVGKLGDGGKFSTRGVVMGEGENAVLSFYAAPKNGRLNGELAFGAGTEPTLSGQLQWFRPPRDGANFFPDGFFVDVNPTGGRYTPPNKNDSAFGGQMETELITLTLSKGDLRTSITHRIQLGDRDSVTILDPGRSDLQFKINRKKGTFSGQFTHNADEENRKFQGALIQSNQSGRGVFIGQHQTGSVELSTSGTPTTLPSDSGQ